VKRRTVQHGRQLGPKVGSKRDQGKDYEEKSRKGDGDGDKKRGGGGWCSEKVWGTFR
jgi:hypothetical protein